MGFTTRPPAIWCWGRQWPSWREDGTPAAGTFPGWPASLKEFTLLDPCCGSGHFLVSAFNLLVPLRMHDDKLSAREACDAVLRENLHGLELDPRCTQIAAFALALSVWRSGGYRELPPPNIAGNDSEQGVRKWNENRPVRLVSFRCSSLQFLVEVTPFVEQLTFGFLNSSGELRGRNLGGVELVGAKNSLVMDTAEERRDGGRRVGHGLKANELRVVLVALCFSAQNLLGQQRFAPQRDDARGVEVFRMKRPQSHLSVLGEIVVRCFRFTHRMKRGSGVQISKLAGPTTRAERWRTNHVGNVRGTGMRD